MAASFLWTINSTVNSHFPLIHQTQMKYTILFRDKHNAKICNIVVLIESSMDHLLDTEM